MMISKKITFYQALRADMIMGNPTVDILHLFYRILAFCCGKLWFHYKKLHDPDLDYNGFLGCHSSLMLSLINLVEGQEDAARTTPFLASS